VQEELVILYRVQPSDSEHYKRLFLAPLWTYCTYGRSIDPEAVHDNFVGTYIRVILKDVAPVIFRDGQAKLAIAELLVEIRGMQQQVGAVQSHAEINSQQARGDHGDRRGEISVMNMNVLNFASVQHCCVVGAQPGMRQSAEASRKWFMSAQEDPL